MGKVLGAAAIALVVLTSSAAVGSPSVDALRVLFIGNSLTAVNDVPGLVTRLASARNQKFESRTVSVGGFSLEDHWNQGDARRAIAEGGWSVVVLQQGPSSLPESRANLIDYAKRFDREIRRAGARTALYMVWPEAGRLAAFEGVRLSYSSAAREVGGVFIPAGEAWREAWRRDSHLALYGGDGFHPTVTGSYLAALTIYQALFDRSPVGLPSLGVEQARLLQEAAAATAARFADPARRR